MRKKYLYDMSLTWIPQKGSLVIPRKIRKDKGSIKGSKLLSEQGKLNIIESNKNRKKNIC